MTKLNQRTKIILSTALFFIVFAALLVTATYTDLAVSKILTKNVLPEGQYLADDVFGVALEICGSSPVYLMIAFCAVILFWYFMKVWKLKPLKYIMSGLMFIIGVVAFWFYFKDIVNYTLEHAGNEALGDKGAVILAEVLSALLINALAVLAGRNLKEETVRKLIKFVLAFVVMAIVANVIVMLVKNPVGRMRFRAMNSSGDTEFAGFTEWYVRNGARKPTEAQALLYGWASDAFKSFPSGHTCAAGMSYALIMLPDALGCKNKKVKVLCWAIPLVWTALVAVSRIMVGAHYFSDVLVGGTLAFACMIIVREIFICKFSHLKALKKNYVAPVDDATC